MSKNDFSGFDYLLKTQKNRYPYLFIDKILSIEPGNSVSTQKSFTFNEWFFPVHFEEDPIVPGFIVMEALIQSFFLIFLSVEQFNEVITTDYSIKEFIIKRSLIPGDTLSIDAFLVRKNNQILEGYAVGMLYEEEVCKIELTVAIPKMLNEFEGERK